MPASLTPKCLAAAVAVVAVLAMGSAASAAFSITVNFTGGLTTSEEAAFTSAKATWESYITGYKTGVNLTGLTISASGTTIDGVGGILGQAGPTNVATRAGTLYSTQGTMQFDTADLATMESNGSLNSVILHEMGHVIGLGTLWTDNNVYVNGTGQYTGANALAAYKQEFNQPSALYVPVELGGGTGTADSHWNEVDGGSGLTGIHDSLGRDMRNELMTGWLNVPTFISNTTVQSFADIGYSVPEPGIIFLVAGASTMLMVRQRQRRNA